MDSTPEDPMANSNNDAASEAEKEQRTLAARLKHHADQSGESVELLGGLAGRYWKALVATGVPDQHASVITAQYVNELMRIGQDAADRKNRPGFDA